MEKARRVSIATLCALVAVAALDLAWWRHITGYSAGHKSLLGFRGPALDAGAMPMASVLAVGLAYVLSNRGRVPRRFVGFLGGGLAGLSLYLIYGWVCLALPRNVFERSMEPIYVAKAYWPRLGSSRYYLYFADVVYYGTPQFLLAVTGGLIWRRRENNV